MRRLGEFWIFFNEDKEFKSSDTCYLTRSSGSSLNLELKIASSDNNLPATCTSVVTRSNSKLSLLSDLFFKPSSNLQDENNEAVLLLQEQDNVLDKSKYFLQTF
ncbi:uncharacterized protein LOC142327911 isoform X1 [Lycorma delicatula]|uniref:uncharacterized protein LOC142327911 isoform X1 n=1 Tax=Lycorma delicatula TaxID=130591 RepID=UPI003F51A324